ncbi:MAG: hypothetical protein NC084_06315 [Bacteroides sp.]|nr:hypothetical protein [Eubacterium sp.]MCM1418161.1 hypothetical protein [Roseburia sp.]MCM1462314.1 hypothetical protein [Bacteroides sp.]
MKKTLKKIDLEARVTVTVYDAKKQAPSIRRAYDVTRSDQYGDIVRYYAAALVGAGCAKTSYDNTARKDMLAIYNSLLKIAADLSRYYDLARSGAEIESFNTYIVGKLSGSDQEVQEYISIALTAMIERAAETAETYDFPALRLLSIRNAARSAVMRYQDSNRRRLDSPINAASIEADRELIDFLTSLQTVREFYAAEDRDDSADFWADYNEFESRLLPDQLAFLADHERGLSFRAIARDRRTNAMKVSRAFAKIRAAAVNAGLAKYL